MMILGGFLKVLSLNYKLFYVSILSSVFYNKTWFDNYENHNYYLENEKERLVV